jgi:DNA-binding transcriptional ArsR family regulator
MPSSPKSASNRSLQPGVTRNLRESIRLDIFPYRNMKAPMARLATTSDVFNAVAEPQRRRIIRFLAAGERPVNDVAHWLQITQPQASKHLRVLREVDLVSVREAGQQRLYRLNAGGLKPIHDWVDQYRRQWEESFDRLDDYLREVQGKPPKRDDQERDQR